MASHLNKSPSTAFKIPSRHRSLFSIQYLEGPWQQFPERLVRQLSAHFDKGGSDDFAGPHWNDASRQSLQTNSVGKPTWFQFEGAPQEQKLRAGRFLYLSRSTKKQIIIVENPSQPTSSESRFLIVVKNGKDMISGPNHHLNLTGCAWKAWRPGAESRKRKDLVIWRVFESAPSTAPHRAKNLPMETPKLITEGAGDRNIVVENCTPRKRKHADVHDEDNETVPSTPKKSMRANVHSDRNDTTCQPATPSPGEIKLASPTTPGRSEQSVLKISPKASFTSPTNSRLLTHTRNIDTLSSMSLEAPPKHVNKAPSSAQKSRIQVIFTDTENNELGRCHFKHCNTAQALFDEAFVRKAADDTTRLLQVRIERELGKSEAVETVKPENQEHFETNVLSPLKTLLKTINEDEVITVNVKKFR